MNNIITCPKCGWNYEWPMFTTVVANCPRCFPFQSIYSNSSTTTTVPETKKNIEES